MLTAVSFSAKTRKTAFIIDVVITILVLIAFALTMTTVHQRYGDSYVDSFYLTVSQNLHSQFCSAFVQARHVLGRFTLGAHRSRCVSNPRLHRFTTATLNLVILSCQLYFCV